MDSLWTLIQNNQILSGLGGVIFLFIATYLTAKQSTPKDQESNQPTTQNQNSPQVTVNVSQTQNDKAQKDSSISPIPSEKKIQKRDFRILFIDNEAFRVVDTLKRSGWNAKRIRDIQSLDDDEIRDTHVFFVDINGVGKALMCKDEGLGLSMALRDRYPEKKLVIYSSQREGDRFHEAFSKADKFLFKNAEYYEFEKIINSFYSA